MGSATAERFPSDHMTKWALKRMLRSWRSFVLALTSLMSACRDSTGLTPTGPGWIAISLAGIEIEREGIYRIRPDGTELQQLTGEGASAAWSPDGRQLVYETHRPNGFGGNDVAIRLHDVSSGSTTSLTQLVTLVMDLDPVWSPDQKQILFVRVRNSPYSTVLFSISPDGTGLHQMGTQLIGGRPDISPDGKRLLVEASDGLYLGSITGEGLVRIPGTRQGDRVPKWAPDGRRLAFARPGEGIQLLNIDGTSLVRLDRSGRSVGYDDHPAWSPDGRRIAFVSIDGLFVARVDDGTVNRILSGPVYEPDWSR